MTNPILHDIIYRVLSYSVLPYEGDNTSHKVNEEKIQIVFILFFTYFHLLLFLSDFTCSYFWQLFEKFLQNIWSFIYLKLEYWNLCWVFNEFKYVYSWLCFNLICLFRLKLSAKTRLHRLHLDRLCLRWTDCTCLLRLEKLAKYLSHSRHCFSPSSLMDWFCFG